MHKLKHLYNSNGTLLTKEELNHKYELHITDMTYISLINAIPNTWKLLMKNNYSTYANETRQKDEIIIGGKKYAIKELTNQILYWHLVNKIIKPPTAINWISEFPFLND
jgi:hypothetical protein